MNSGDRHRIAELQAIRCLSPEFSYLRLSWKRRRILRRLAVMRRLLVRICQLKNGSLLVGTPHEGDASGKIVHCETRGHSDHWNEDQERVEMRDAFCVYERRI